MSPMVFESLDTQKETQHWPKGLPKTSQKQVLFFPGVGQSLPEPRHLGPVQRLPFRSAYRCILNYYPMNSKTILWGNSEITPLEIDSHND